MTGQTGQRVEGRGQAERVRFPTICFLCLRALGSSARWLEVLEIRAHFGAVSRLC